MKRECFIDCYSGRKGCYMLSSSHLLKHRIFRAESDFKFGVNTLALLLPGSGVRLLAYCLMDNHIHLLLVGTLQDCLAYYDKVLHRLSIYLKAEHGISRVMKTNDLDILSVTEDTQLKYIVCYIHRNPYKARMASPVSYPWSSADCYFPVHRPVGERVSSLKYTEHRRLFKTDSPFPEGYEHYNGRVLNACFVSSDLVSGKFRDSVEYFDLLRKYSLESEVEIALGIEDKVVFSDIELEERIRTVCRTEFHVESVNLLGRKDLLRLARVVSARYGVGQKQLSRILGLDKLVLDRIL